MKSSTNNLPKMLALWVLGLVWGLWLVAPAWAAAKVPVYINGAYVVNNEWRGSEEEYRLLTQAVERGGHTYVPLRVVFEACGAEVSWDAGKQIITARDGGRRTIIMQVGSRQVKLMENKYTDNQEIAGTEEVRLELEAAPYLQGGSVYVPLRFVAETMGCGVDWRGAKPEVRLKKDCLDYVIMGGKLYRLDRYSGRLTENVGSASQELGVIDLSGLATGSSVWLQRLEKTPGGHYIAQVRAVIDGALTSEGYGSCWLAPDKGLVYMVSEVGYGYADDKPNWLEYGDGSRELCLAGSEILIIDDDAGELKQRFEKGRFQWANQDWLLRGHNSSWELVNRRDKSIRDLSPLLLSEENKARMDAAMAANFDKYDENDREWFWEMIDNDMLPDQRPYIELLSEENGVLHFKMKAVGYFMTYDPKDVFILIDVTI